MARITVEGCLAYVSNRFALVKLATKRARELKRGEKPFVLYNNDKSAVVALREIEGGFVREKKESEETE